MSSNVFKGRRVQIAGSVAKQNCTGKHARYAHAVVAALVARLVRGGATFVVPIDGEPRCFDDADSPALTFDWTVLESVWGTRHQRPSFKGLPDRHLLHAVMHAKNGRQIPADRVELWDAVLAAGASGLTDVTDVGDWNVAAIRREAQARIGDILLLLGGHEGAAHLANLYHAAGKPVVALDLPLGFPEHGAELLARQAVRHPEQYFRTQAGASASALLKRASLVQMPSVEDAVGRISDLLEALEGPTAFFVRLLDPAADPQAFQDVDYYLREVVEREVRDAGYEPVTIGLGRSEDAFINTEIFRRLHHSQLVVVDLTSLRPNCFIELGYALGRGLTTLVLKRNDDDRLPFDITTLPTHFWSPDTKDVPAREAFLKYWRKQVNRRSIVESGALI